MFWLGWDHVDNWSWLLLSRFFWNWFAEFLPLNLYDFVFDWLPWIFVSMPIFVFQSDNPMSSDRLLFGVEFVTIFSWTVETILEFLMCFLVLFHIAFGCSSMTTCWTFERFFSCVFLFVAFEIWRLSECFVTSFPIAFERSFTSMFSSMFDQSAQLSECSFAENEFADISSNVIVSVQVNFQRLLVGQLFWAFWTLDLVLGFWLSWALFV